MMFWLMQQQFFFGKKGRNRRRTFAIFGVLMLSLFFVTQIHHATLQQSGASTSLLPQEQQGEALTSLPPNFQKRQPKKTSSSMKTKVDDEHLLHASNADRNNEKKGHKPKVEPSKQQIVAPLQILDLVKTQKVQTMTTMARLQKLDANNNDNSSRSTYRNKNSTISTIVISATSRRRRPPLDQLVQGDAITGNVSWLLDFAILGHAKCATTFLSSWFREHSSVQVR
jgi:hypothetical protein